MRRAIKNLLAFLLGHTPDHRDNLALFKVLQPVEDFLFRLVANAAGIKKKVVRLVRRPDLRIAFLQQSTDDLLGVMGIHLTPKSLNVKGFFHENSDLCRAQRRPEWLSVRSFIFIAHNGGPSGRLCALSSLSRTTAARVAACAL